MRPPSRAQLVLDPPGGGGCSARQRNPSCGWPSSHATSHRPGCAPYASRRLPCPSISRLSFQRFSRFLQTIFLFEGLGPSSGAQASGCHRLLKRPQGLSPALAAPHGAGAKQGALGACRRCTNAVPGCCILQHTPAAKILIARKHALRQQSTAPRRRPREQRRVVACASGIESSKRQSRAADTPASLL